LLIQHGPGAAEIAGKASFFPVLAGLVGLSCIHPTTPEPPFVANKAQLSREAAPGEHVQTAAELFWPV